MGEREEIEMTDEYEIKQLKKKLAISKEALENWLEWEDKQIQKNGAYVGVEINQLIKNGKEALAAINGEH